MKNRPWLVTGLLAGKGVGLGFQTEFKANFASNEGFLADFAGYHSLVTEGKYVWSPECIGKGKRIAANQLGEKTVLHTVKQHRGHQVGMLGSDHPGTIIIAVFKGDIRNQRKTGQRAN